MNNFPLSTLLSRAALLPLLAGPGLALAHAGHEPGMPSFVAGLLHPLTGMDHLLAMLAVGLWAAQLRGVAGVLLPALFPAVMVAGAAMALAGIGIPAVEPMIAASVVVLGAAVTIGARPPTALAAVLVGLFALAHGHAHGSELPPGGNVAGYAAGFVGATVALHIAGLFLGLQAQRWRGGVLARLGGSAIAASGLALLVT